MNYVLQPAETESDESIKNRYEKLLQDTTLLMRRFTDSAEQLMAEAMDNMGFTLVQTSGTVQKLERE